MDWIPYTPGSTKIALENEPRLELMYFRIESMYTSYWKMVDFPLPAMLELVYQEGRSQGGYNHRTDNAFGNSLICQTSRPWPLESWSFRRAGTVFPWHPVRVGGEISSSQIASPLKGKGLAILNGVFVGVNKRALLEETWRFDKPFWNPCCW